MKDDAIDQTSMLSQLLAARVTIVVHVTVRTISIIRVHVAIRVGISIQAGNTAVEIGRTKISHLISGLPKNGSINFQRSFSPRYSLVEIIFYEFSH